MGFYLPLADDVEEGFESDADWEPSLYPYQQEAANVLFFTFINPSTMVVPKAFEKLAATRGTGAEGAIPEDTSGLDEYVRQISFFLSCNLICFSYSFCHWRLWLQHGC